MGGRKVRVLLAASAYRDLEALLTHYEEQGVAKAGQRWAVEILTRIERMARHPSSGRIVPEFGVEYLREWIHPPFRIVYKMDAGQCWVIRIWRSERLLRIDT